MKKETVAVACTTSDGSPTIAYFDVEVTDEQYDLGGHYDAAKELALEDRFEPPFVCFDNFEHRELFRSVEVLKEHLNES